MAVRLEAIQFNHDASGAATDALSIRHDAATSVTVPEWRHGVSVHPWDSPAAYSIADTHGQTVTLRVQLRRTDANV
ncbi:MAG: hypothetical protein ACRELX_15495, partial [Longimicrobiales bacterium]